MVNTHQGGEISFRILKPTLGFKRLAEPTSKALVPRLSCGGVAQFQNTFTSTKTRVWTNYLQTVMQSRSSLSYFYLILYYVECFRGRIQALVAQTQATLAVTLSATPWGKPLTQAKYSPPSSGADLRQRRQLEREATISNNSAHLDLSSSYCPRLQGEYVSKNQVQLTLFLLVTP